MRKIRKFVSIVFIGLLVAAAASFATGCSRQVESSNGKKYDDAESAVSDMLGRDYKMIASVSPGASDRYYIPICAKSEDTAFDYTAVILAKQGKKFIPLSTSDFHFADTAAGPGGQTTSKTAVYSIGDTVRLPNKETVKVTVWNQGDGHFLGVYSTYRGAVAGSASGYAVEHDIELTDAEH